MLNFIGVIASHFLVDHGAIEKEVIPNIHDYLMIKNTIKQTLELLRKRCVVIVLSSFSGSLAANCILSLNN